ncbi:hypothetical protein GJ744_008000 [Endocarpon pusillum]|uniref:Uncharacterized protein n=1 Tax=Endocarpon pusillum TaxID=364733 RepID=A0A8H7AM38_9EURO|nr:hypothetical protein GJ744_008000 [Endocarpon pusillum]
MQVWCSCSAQQPTSDAGTHDSQTTIGWEYYEGNRRRRRIIRGSALEFARSGGRDKYVKRCSWVSLACMTTFQGRMMGD